MILKNPSIVKSNNKFYTTSTALCIVSDSSKLIVVPYKKDGMATMLTFEIKGKEEFDSTKESNLLLP